MWGRSPHVFGDEALDDPANPTFTVAELADAVNSTLRRGFGDGVWVRGEIQGWSERGGHAYFALADDSPGRQAVLRVQFFANARQRLRPLLATHRLRLGDGMKVRIFGHLDFYAPSGQLGLKLVDLDPRFTLGDLAQQRDQVLRRLAADGSLDANRRRPLSPVPLRVGVVSSAGTAAWHDFHDELVRSGFGFQLVLADTRVQGPEASRAVSRAIRALSHHAGRRGLDVIVVIRGGGARNELATFDSEPIARAIAAAPGAGAHRPRPRDRPQRRRRGRPHVAEDTDCVCRARWCRPSPATSTPSSGATRRCSSRRRRVLAAADRGIGDRAHRIARRTHSAVERADERLGHRVHRLRAAASAATRRRRAPAVAGRSPPRRARSAGPGRRGAPSDRHRGTRPCPRSGQRAGAWLEHHQGRRRAGGSRSLRGRHRRGDHLAARCRFAAQPRRAGPEGNLMS